MCIIDFMHWPPLTSCIIEFQIIYTAHLFIIVFLLRGNDAVPSGFCFTFPSVSFVFQIFLFCTYIVLYILYMMTSLVSNQARGTRDKTLPTTTQTTQQQKQIQVGDCHCKYRVIKQNSILTSIKYCIS